MRHEAIGDAPAVVKNEKTLKMSKYNHFIYLEDEGTYLIYNSISNGLAKLKSSVFDLLKKGKDGIKSLQQDDSNAQLMEQLKSGHVIIDEDFDELEFLKVNFNINRFARKTLSLTIVTTLDCNFNCQYCYQDDSLKKYTSETLDEDILNFVKKQVERFGYKGLSVTWYGGEPLLNKKFVYSLSRKFINFCKSEDLTYDASIVSNGTILNKEIAKRLRGLKVNYMQITIDGPKEIHDKRRPFKHSSKSSFDVIVKNMERVYGIMPMQIRVNVDKTNFEKAIKLFAYFQEKGFFEDPKLFGIYIGFVKEWTANCSNIASDCFTMREFSEAELNFQKMLFANGISGNFYPTPLRSYCGATTPHSYVIDPTGDLHKCWSDVGNKEAYLGNVREPISYNKTLLKWLGYDALTKSAKCRNCSFFPVCGGGCPYIPIKHSEKLEKDSELNCTPWRLMLEEKMRLFLEQKARELKNKK